MTRKIVESTFVTLDGVIENPHHWSPNYWDDEHANYASKMLAGADTLLLGRETYDAFAEAWPSTTSRSPISTSSTRRGSLRASLF